ncbi:hypothetical protein BB558_004576, partial [Smittium angustum]
SKIYSSASIEYNAQDVKNFKAYENVNYTNSLGYMTGYGSFAKEPGIIRKSLEETKNESESPQNLIFMEPAKIDTENSINMPTKRSGYNTSKDLKKTYRKTVIGNTHTFDDDNVPLMNLKRIHSTRIPKNSFLDLTKDNENYQNSSSHEDIDDNLPLHELKMLNFKQSNSFHQSKEFESSNDINDSVPLSILINQGETNPKGLKSNVNPNYKKMTNPQSKNETRYSRR